MSTEWVITTAAERITLDDQKRGETTFTVTNPGPRADRAVFEVVPGDGADRSWFSVEEPQRLVRGNASVAYLMRVAVAPGAPSGSYAVQGRVYSADAAPEESSVLSRRVLLEVKPAPVPPPKRRPWWLLLVAALVALVLGVVIWLVARDGGSPGTVTAPDLTRQTEAQAIESLRAAGLAAGAIQHRHDPAATAATVAKQSVPAGQAVPRGTPVDLEIAVKLGAPRLTGPGDGTRLAAGSPVPALQWEQAEPYVTRWYVAVFQEVCTYADFVPPRCGYFPAGEQVVEARSVRPQLIFIYEQFRVAGSRYQTGRVRWQVTALDEFGGRGTPSPAGTFQVG